MNMTAALVLWLCTSAAMDDCQVYVMDSWHGEDARRECREALGASAPEMRKVKSAHVRLTCEVESEPSVRF